MGRALERRRTEFLEDMAGLHSPRRVLLLGDGDGRFLAALLAANPAVLVDTVDSSAAMLRLARQRAVRQLGEAEAVRRVHFHHANALNWLPPADRIYHAVASHFFLDCLTEPQIDALLTQLDFAVARDAAWIVSEFHQPGNGPAAWRARLWIGGLYRFFGWFTKLAVRRLPDYRTCLSTHGYKAEKQVFAEHGLLVSERWRRGNAGFCV